MPDSSVSSRLRACMLPSDKALAISEESIRAAALVNAFPNPVRGQILMYVAQFTALTVSDLATLTDTSVSLMSLYVRKIGEDGWVCVESIGRERHVRMASEHRLQIVELVRHHSRHLK